MANCVRSISSLSAGESSRKICENEPAESSGKSDCGRHCSLKADRPEITDIEPPDSSVASITSAPSGSLRTMS